MIIIVSTLQSSADVGFQLKQVMLVESSDETAHIPQTSDVLLISAMLSNYVYPGFMRICPKEIGPSVCSVTRYTVYTV